ncbi:MAG: HEAT repeat domain-containing protein [Chlamydiales bacterium]|nr:HEAT repeat domain-containing protein [Chlamydiales bacterium]
MLLARLIICLFCCQCVALSATEAESCRRVYAHLTLHDNEGALQEADAARKLYPNSVALAKARIEALAAAGHENAMMGAYKDLLVQFPDESQDRTLLEIMAWGIIKKGAHSASPITVATALLAAQKGSDSRGVTLLAEGMRNHNSLIRGISVDLVGQMRDASLCSEIVRLLNQERTWSVRLAAIHAVGHMKVRDAQGICENILANPMAQAEEKAAAIESIVNLMDSAKPINMDELVSSNRAGMRLLACQIAAFCGEFDDISPLYPLLSDVNAEVRSIALQVIGLLRSKDQDSSVIISIAQSKLADPEPMVAISAAWLLTLEDSVAGQKALRKWLSYPKREVRLQATAALVSTGKHGLPLMRDIFEAAQDPYIRMNLALGLIGQRIAVPEACAALTDALKINDRWMWEKEGLFRYVGPSTERHRDGIPNYPEAVNQLVRLEILNVLAMMKSPDAQPSLRRFLKERNWGITGMAALLLLSEGNEDAVEVVATLLTDPDPKVRMQAALAMGLLGADPRAVGVLEASYASGDRAVKEKVLEAVGKIGRMASVPFLVEKLSEPHQNLRIFASAALLQCLNH